MGIYKPPFNHLVTSAVKVRRTVEYVCSCGYATDLSGNMESHIKRKNNEEWERFNKKGTQYEENN